MTHTGTPCSLLYVFQVPLAMPIVIHLWRCCQGSQNPEFLYGVRVVLPKREKPEVISNSHQGPPKHLAVQVMMVRTARSIMHGACNNWLHNWSYK